MNNTAKRVLVVDDESRILRFARICLESHGYDVAVATGGEQALRMVETETPDIILLDIIMPDMDGFEVMRRLRRSSSLPVIAWSADSTKAEEIIGLGATFFFQKPVDPLLVAEKIGDVLDASPSNRQRV